MKTVSILKMIGCKMIVKKEIKRNLVVSIVYD